jgi:DNA-binding GntR family transcriptional regulator
MARAQGIPVHFLAASFALSRETIQKALREQVAV